MADSNRRNFLKMGMGTAGALAFGGPISKAFAEACGITPDQTPGPFYPGEQVFSRDNDLTTISASSVKPLGQIIYISGKVQDENCRPVTDAIVEIWQACQSGRYNNRNDPNPAPLDANFKYWGEDYTDANGNYLFKSIIPGAYPADTDWIRPSHVHFKVSKRGYHELITQMYFKGDPHNDKDLILQALSKSEQDKLVVDFKASPRSTPMEAALEGEFLITLKKVSG